MNEVFRFLPLLLVYSFTVLPAVWGTFQLLKIGKRLYDDSLRNPLSNEIRNIKDKLDCMVASRNFWQKGSEDNLQKFIAANKRANELEKEISRRTVKDCDQTFIRIPEIDPQRNRADALEAQLKVVVESRKQSAEQAESLAKQLAEERAACERMKGGLDYFHKRWENVSGQLRKFWLARNYWKDQAERFQIALTRSELECGALRRELELELAHKSKRKLAK